jgi:lincosamide and streptogramin A transport system ATP-binding/permease protein
MSQILITGLSFSYCPHYHKVFHNVTLNLDTDWKLGVIGRNGRGKTTFLKLLSGELLPETGHIEKQVNVEYFPYDYKGDYSNTLDIIMECAGGLRTLEKELDHPDVLQKYMDLEGFSMEGKIKREIKRMGLEEELLTRDFATLSGGEQTKVLLISLFVKQNTFILLDEPTNHLDVKGKEEVADYLKKKNGFMVVSHDRELIDSVADHILSLNKSDIKVEKGNYTTWKNNKDLTEEYEFRTKKNIGREIKRLEGHAVKKRGWALVSNTQKYPFASHARTNGVQAYFRQAKRAEILIEGDIRKKKALLLNYEEVKKLEFHQGTVEGEWLIKVDKLSYSYVPHRVILQDISLIINQGDAVWIKGPNGSGKTTLLKLISRERYSPSIQYEADMEFSILNQDLYFEDKVTGYDFLKEGGVSEIQYEESLRLCDMFDIVTEELYKPCNLFSSGEQKKLVLAKLLCQKKPVIILDEPLNYMDVMFREQLEKAILQMKPTIIFVEHDVRFGERVANKRIELG